jgi:hypothetical protein
MERNPFHSMREELSREREPWDRDTDPAVWGRVIELGVFEGEYGAAQVVVLLTEDGREVAVHAFGTVLSEALARIDLQVGDHLGVRYLGEKTGRTGKSYHDYRIIHRDAQGNPKVRTQGRSAAPVSFTEVDNVEDDVPLFGDEEPF